MEIIYPEIALKQPKADPRTVVLRKRNFMESSSDHMQDFYGNSQKIIASIANCDKSQNTICRYTTTTTTTKIDTLKNSLKSSSPALFLASTLTSLSSSLLSSNLVNFSKSCHFKNSFNNYLYKTQKTKYILFLLFLWCAIFLQTTQAVPTRRISTSGRKLILHTNVYRERYHQKLLEEQRQHKQQQFQIQQQLKEQQQQRQLQLQHLQQQHQLETQSQTYSHYQHLQQQHHHSQTQTQPQPQVQRNHIFSPIHHIRRHPQQLPKHLHHLHQRAAPLASATVHHQKQQQYKMSACNSNSIYFNLRDQMGAAMGEIKRLCKIYLRDRSNETYENMSKLWRQSNLQIRNPNRQPVSIDNELHREIYEFYINLRNFDMLLDHAYNDTEANRKLIEHSESIDVQPIIMEFFQKVKHEIEVSRREAAKLMEDLQIEVPDLSEHQIDFDTELGGRVRDFLIIKNVIEEFERVLQLVENYCENNSEE